MVANEGTNQGKPRGPALRTLQVLRTAQLTPGMRRITLGGEEIAGFGQKEHGPNVKLFFPRPGQIKPVLPSQTQSGGILWPPEEVRPIVRTYTVRRHDPETGELDIDFVLHGGQGVASNWASRAKPGDFIGVTGPGGLTVWEAEWYLLAGDQSALPAISVILEKLPASARGQAFVEIPEAAEEQPLTFQAQIELTWLHRNGVAAGQSTLLQEAVRALKWPAGERVFAWVAGESAAVKAIRRHVLTERGLDRRRCCPSAIGSWG